MFSLKRAIKRKKIGPDEETKTTKEAWHWEDDKTISKNRKSSFGKM